LGSRAENQLTRKKNFQRQKQRKSDFALWLPDKKSSVRRRQNLAVPLMETGAQELTRARNPNQKTGHWCKNKKASMAARTADEKWI
jgi:hypothetical protein